MNRFKILIPLFILTGAGALAAFAASGSEIYKVSYPPAPPIQTAPVQTPPDSPVAPSVDNPPNSGVNPSSTPTGGITPIPTQTAPAPQPIYNPRGDPYYDPNGTTQCTRYDQNGEPIYHYMCTMPAQSPPAPPHQAPAPGDNTPPPTPS